MLIGMYFQKSSGDKARCCTHTDEEALEVSAEAARRISLFPAISALKPPAEEDLC